MPKSIWKFPLTEDLAALANGIHVAVPQGGELLTCALQDGMPTLWFLVDPDNPKEGRTFRIVGTGHHEVQDSWEYAHSWQDVQPFGTFVWHLFEIPFGATGRPSPL